MTAAFFDPDGSVTPKVQAAFEAAVTKYAARPEVSGIDVGYVTRRGARTGEIGVRLHVREKVAKRALPLRERFPSQILGVRLDVIEGNYHPGSGGATALALAPTLVGATTSIQPGLSGGLADGPTGTLGLFVATPDGRPAVLGAAHVFAAGSETSPGALIIQPGRADGGMASDAIAALARMNTANDTALALFTDERRALDPTPIGATQPPSSARIVRVGDILQKSGRTTGVTRAEVDGKGHYYGVQFAFRLVPLPGDVQPICLEGDSGAPWYDPQTAEAVGLHCRGGALPVSGMNFGVATSVPHILAHWGLSLLAAPPQGETPVGGA